MFPLADQALATLDVHPGKYFRLPGGRRLHYAEYGVPHGTLAFYFHGTPGSHLEVGLIDEELETSEVRLVSVNRPGMGRSTYDPCRQILDWPRDIAALADTIAGPGARFAVIAISGGAPYGLAVARAMPERVAHLALVAGHTPPDAPCVRPGTADSTIELIRRRPRLGRLGLGVAERMTDRNPDKVVKLVTSSWSEGDRRLVLCNPTLYRRLVANLQMATCCGAAGVQRDITLLGSCWGFAVREAAGVGVSIWQGGCDRIVTPSMARYFHSQLPGSELMIDPSAGHVSIFKRHVNEILARI